VTERKYATIRSLGASCTSSKMRAQKIYKKKMMVRLRDVWRESPKII